jgi:hypothetical protein
VVEHLLAKEGVAGSSPVSRFTHKASYQQSKMRLLNLELIVFDPENSIHLSIFFVLYYQNLITNI